MFRQMDLTRIMWSQKSIKTYSLLYSHIWTQIVQKILLIINTSYCQKMALEKYNVVSGQMSQRSQKALSLL